jgi:hypothetical protein
MRRAWASGIAVVGVYAALGIVPYWSYWNAGGAMIAGKGGDPATDAWFLAWVPYALTHGHNPLVTNWGNYPGGVNAITGVGMPLLGVVGAPVTWAFGAFVTTTLFFTLAFPLSAIAGYAVIREWVSWRPAAFTGGLLYGFSPYLVAHGGSHLNLTFVPLPPLIFLALTRIARGGQGGQGLRWGLLLGGLCVAQFLISAEVLASTVIIGAIGLAVTSAVNWPAAGQRWRDATKAIAAALGVVVVCLGYPVYLMLAGPEHLTRPAQETRLYRGNLLAPAVPDSTMFFHTTGSARLANTFSGGTSENGLYLGLPLLVVLVAGAVMLWRRPAMKIAVVVTAVAFVLSLGSRLVVGHHLISAVPLPAAIFDHIPVLDNTIAARYSLYVMLGAALILALILETVQERPALTGALAVVVLLPLLPAWPLWLHVTQPPPYFSSAVAQESIPEGSVALTYPFPSNADAYPMVWQVAAGMRYRTPGGRFVIPPRQQPLLVQVLTDLDNGHPPARTAALYADLTAQLRAWHVRTVLVQVTGPLVLPFFEWLLARPPDTSTGGISAWYGTDQVTGAQGTILARARADLTAVDRLPMSYAP